MVAKRTYPARYAEVKPVKFCSRHEKAARFADLVVHHLAAKSTDELGKEWQTSLVKK